MRFYDNIYWVRKILRGMLEDNRVSEAGINRCVVKCASVCIMEMIYTLCVLI